MPQVSQNFGPIYQNVTLDGSGNGTVSFQATGSAVRVSNIFFRVATSTAQAVCTIYKGQVATGNIIFNSNSGSTGGNAKGNVDLVDGETCFVRWTGGDAGAIATATFTGQEIPFLDIKPTNLSFDDPIAAGDGSLIFPAIKSVNYVPGVSGWKIDRDGDVEFDDATIRGSISADGGNITLDDNGITVVGTTQTIQLKDNGLKVFLNSDPDAYVFIAGNSTFGGIINLKPLDSTVSGVTFVDGFVFAGRDETATDSRPYLKLLSPCITDTPNLHTSQIILQGQSLLSAVNDARIVLESPTGFFYTDYDVDSGRGFVNHTGRDTNSAAIGSTETVVLTFPSMTYKANRAYMLIVSGDATASVTPNRPSFRLRKTNAAGLQIGATGIGIGAAGMHSIAWSCVFYVGASDVTATLVVTALGTAAFTVTTLGSPPYTADIMDIGNATTGSTPINGYADLLS